MEEYYTKENAAEEIPLEEKEESEEIQAFANLIEVWSAVILYIDAGFDLVSSLPDAQLRYVFIINYVNYYSFSSEKQIYNLENILLGKY